MKLNVILLTGSALLDATASAIAIPDITALTSLSHPAPLAQRDEPSTSLSDLFKRKGGGGGGGKGGSSGSSSGGENSRSYPVPLRVSLPASRRKGGSSPSSTSTGKSGSSGSSSSSSSSSGRGSSSSSAGGRTTTGSGAAASYGGGKYYGGGTTVPYRAGAVSTLGITPLLFVGGASLLFWPGIWYHPVYMYPYGNPWTYHNETTNANETKPVKCGCDAYQECGCDDNNSTDYVNSVLGTGAYSQLNQSLVTVASVNGTDTILVNGTLPNGTTASGGTESASAGVGMRRLAEMAGWWPAAATVLAIALYCP